MRVGGVDWTCSSDPLLLGAVIERKGGCAFADCMDRFLAEERFGAVGIEHDGGGPGFLAWLSTIPSARVTVAVAVNGFDETKPEQAKAFAAGVDAMIATLVDR